MEQKAPLLVRTDMSSDGGLRPMFRDHLRVGFHWQSLELGLVGAGCPDSCFGQRLWEPFCEGWVEFKQTNAWAVTLRPEQIGWLVQRSRHGGRCFVAVRRWRDTGEDGLAVDELWLHDGRWARELRAGGLRAVEPLLHERGGPRNWDWDEVARLLATHTAGPGS